MTEFRGKIYDSIIDTIGASRWFAFRVWQKQKA